MPNIVVIGASAGGVQTLRKIVAPLPKDLRAAVFVVMHISPMGPSLLPELLNRGSLPAAAASDGERILPSRIYVAPPDHHMLIDGGVIRVTRGPKEHRFRPAIDPLFRTAAWAYGNRVLGVVLTGLLGDGSVGLQTIKSAGGTVLVQDPDEALFDEMPLNAVRNVDVDFIVPTGEIGPKIAALARERWKDVARICRPSL
jgi:two-component system chemotaxis response regulator CheB